MVKKILMYIVGAGVALAILRAFNFDPFGILSYVWDWGSYVVTGIADFLGGNKTFHKVLEKPS